MNVRGVGERREVWLAILAAHSSWAMYPVLNKALLNYLPPFALLAVANSLALVIALVVARRHLSRAFLSDRALWVFALITAARSITNILSVRYTLAIYVQLINLSTPFHVAWLGRLLLKEKIPPYTCLALAVSSLGAYLALSPDPSRLHMPGGPTDTLGIGLALLSAIFLALYMTWARKTTARAVHPTAVFFNKRSRWWFCIGAPACSAAKIGRCGVDCRPRLGENWRPWCSLCWWAPRFSRFGRYLG